MLDVVACVQGTQKPWGVSWTLVDNQLVWNRKDHLPSMDEISILKHSTSRLICECCVHHM